MGDFLFTVFVFAMGFVIGIALPLEPHIPYQRGVCYTQGGKLLEGRDAFICTKDQTVLYNITLAKSREDYATYRKGMK